MPAFDPTQPLSAGGYNWSLTPAGTQPYALNTAQGQMYDPLGPLSQGFGVDPAALQAAGYTGPMPFAGVAGESGWQTPPVSADPLKQWLAENNYYYGQGTGGNKVTYGIFDPSGNMVGSPSGGGTMNDPTGLAIGALGIGGFGALAAGGAGGAAAAGGGGGLTGVDAAMADYAAAGGGAGMAGGGAAAAPAFAGTGGLPGAGYGTGAAASTVPAAGTAASGGWGGILSQLGTPGSGGWRGIVNLLAGLYGANKTSQLGKLPSMADYMASPMYGAGEQAVTRSMAAQGYQGSGNMMQALAQNAQRGYADYVSLLTGRQGAAGNLPSSIMSSLGLASTGLPAIWNLISGVGGSAAGAAAGPGGDPGAASYPDISSIWGGN